MRPAVYNVLPAASPARAGSPDPRRPSARGGERTYTRGGRSIGAGVAERTNARALRARGPLALVGSNPTPGASRQGGPGHLDAPHHRLQLLERHPAAPRPEPAVRVHHQLPGIPQHPRRVQYAVAHELRRLHPVRVDVHDPQPQRARVAVLAHQPQEVVADPVLVVRPQLPRVPVRELQRVVRGPQLQGVRVEGPVVVPAVADVHVYLSVEPPHRLVERLHEHGDLVRVGRRGRLVYLYPPGPRLHEPLEERPYDVPRQLDRQLPLVPVIFVVGPVRYRVGPRDRYLRGPRGPPPDELELPQVVVLPQPHGPHDPRLPVVLVVEGAHQARELEPLYVPDRVLVHLDPPDLAVVDVVEAHSLQHLYVGQGGLVPRELLLLLGRPAPQEGEEPRRLPQAPYLLRGQELPLRHASPASPGP